MSSSEQLKQPSKEAKLWAYYLAKEMKTKEANNPNTVFLLGREVLKKSVFDSLNNEEDAVVHGVQVFYGPFDSVSAAQEFVASYPEDLWPGHNDWRYIYPGKPEIISSYIDPKKVDIVHNTSLDVQVQLGYNETQRKMQEIEDIKKKLEQREKLENLQKKPLSLTEKELHVKMQQQRIDETEKQLVQLKKHLLHLQSLPAQ